MQFLVVWLTIIPVMNVAVFVTAVAVRMELLLIIKFTMSVSVAALSSVHLLREPGGCVAL